MKNQNARTLIFLLFLLLTIYCYGAGMMDYFAIYEPWKLIDAEDFAAFHQYQGVRVLSIFVLPSAIMTIFNILTVIFPPGYVLRRWLVYSLVAYSFDWIFSFTMQIPIQLELETRKDMLLLEELLSTNWYRFAADTLQFMIVCFILFQLLKKLESFSIARI
jgi:hypothetical protein